MGMAKQALSIPKLVERIPDENAAYLFLEGLRWPDDPICPHCGNDKAYFLTPKNGVGRGSGKKRNISVRRVWKCAKCRKQFSVLTGTVMHGSKISVRTWVFVLYEMAASKNGVSAREISRKYEITDEAAWFMCHRIREAMKRDPLASLLRGTVVSDETWIGGNPKNLHAAKRYSPRRRVHTNKTPVMALVDKQTGEVRSRVLPHVTGNNLRAAMRENIDVPNSVLHTDESSVYKQLGQEFPEHHSVNHKAGEYVRGDVSTNVAESYFAQLKRSIDGTHHNVSIEHLPRYLAEYDFRFSTKKLTDAQRMMQIVAQAGGRRLSYEPITRL
jgi:transposase-like protein